MAVDPAFLEQMMEVLSDPMGLPSEFWEYATQSWLKDAPVFPISQVFGYNTVTAHLANAEGETAVTSTSYSAFSGAPSITGLADGHYVVLWGCSAKGDDTAGGSALQIAVQANGSGNTNFAESQEQNYYTSIARGDIVTLSASNNNTLQLVALTTIGGHTSKVRYTWLMCLKYANL